MNDYYNYLNNGYGDINYMPYPNNMIDDMNYQNAFQNTFLQNNPNQNISGPNLGFKRGNMFNNLYSEYKSYKPQELKASNEKEDMLMQIRELKFATIDLNLYLDMYPNDRNALNLFNTYLSQEKDLCSQYESKYGPLTLDSPVQANNWPWDNGPWAWEVQK